MLTTHKLTITIQQQIICQNFNFALLPGEIVGLLGPNGFGKTIFLHTLAGLLHPDQGNIFIGEKNIKNMTSRELAKKRALLFQNTRTLFPRNVFEFCLSGRYPHQSLFSKANQTDHIIVTEALTIMELDHKIKQNSQTLSGGELRRLAIATVLAQTPHILLLDEPLNHLDPRHQIKLFSHLKKIARTQKISILMTLHDPFIFSQQCDKILLPTESGQFLQGTPKTLLTEEHVSQLYRIPLQQLRNFKKY